jgi:hypothetical protein
MSENQQTNPGTVISEIQYSLQTPRQQAVNLLVNNLKIPSSRDFLSTKPLVIRLKDELGIPVNRIELYNLTQREEEPFLIDLATILNPTGEIKNIIYYYPEVKAKLLGEKFEYNPNFPIENTEIKKDPKYAFLTPKEIAKRRLAAYLNLPSSEDFLSPKGILKHLKEDMGYGINIKTLRVWSLREADPFIIDISTVLNPYGGIISSIYMLSEVKAKIQKYYAPRQPKFFRAILDN